jgi:carbohydrate-selective porin OprB
VLFVFAVVSAAALLPAAAADLVHPRRHYPVQRQFWRFFDVTLQQKHVTGNWGGLHDELESIGVTLTATYTTDLLGNPVGGNTQGFRHAGDMAVDLHVDLEKLWVLFPLFFWAGLVYTGFIPGCANDTSAFGLAYGKFSKYLKGQDGEMVVEWTYAMTLAPWLTLQPDVQYIIKPSGMSQIANALVLGMQIAVNF